ncbi:MAG: chorismate synthase [Bacteroidales bacterium]|nr:chorismate synthase [Bacteroidales bacterium]
MSNSIGHIFRLTTFGESHGVAVGGVIDGCPSRITIDIEAIRRDLRRRRGDGMEGVTSRHETDEVEWLSGILDDQTLGTPIAFLVYNRDAHSDDYQQYRNLFRPGHCDYTWQQRYGIRDWRGGGRSAARETLARVVAGAIAKQVLDQRGITVVAEVDLLGSAPPDDTVGGIVRCTITGLPVGMGQPLFGKMQSQLASAMLSIPSATGFEFGEGFRAVTLSGSQYIDRWNSDFTTQTNHCGGLQGGLTNGMPLYFRVPFHPVVTLPQPLPCVDAEGQEHIVEPRGRHDRSHVQRATVVVEAMAALVVLDNLLLLSNTASNQ